MYRFNSFTTKSNEAINNAIKYAEKLGHNYVGSEHLLVGILKEDMYCILIEYCIYLYKVENIIKEEIGVGNQTKLSPDNFTPRVRRIIESSFQIARSTKHSFVNYEHLLLALLKEDDSYALKIIEKLGANKDKIIDDVSKDIIICEPSNINSNSPKKKSKNKTSTLDEFGIELTEYARGGRIDPVIGREKEITRAIQILSRRNKNNPCLIGEPGVGKTAIIEGLALKIVNNEVPDILKNKKIYSLDLNSMVAGTKYRGDFEERIKKAMNEAKEADDVIIFIDEIHNIMGAGSAEGAIDAANILKPSLARGDIQVIGATTISEYRKNIEKDSALERRFQVINVEEPSIGDTVEIIKGIKDKYEDHHNVKFNDGVITHAVNLAERYINDRFMPDKAIDLIDEALSMARLNSKEEINKDDIEKVLSSWTGVPVEKISKNENDKLLNLEENLSRAIIGQDKAINTVSKAIRRGRIGINNPDRPTGVFLFLGPTGVGKTELCKALAENVFDSKKSLIRFDMSEYMDKHSLSKLIGSPPGYVGYEEGGQLTEKVRRNPYSIVLFDEIEKAHKDIYNIMLQIFDDGVLTDSQGGKVSFKNSLIIMTSNIGASKIVDKRQGLGFINEEDNMDTMIMDEVKNTFKPEFINRIDEIVIFNKLELESIKAIARNLLNQLANRTMNLGIELSFSELAIREITRRGYDVKNGARPLKRAIQNEVEDKLSDMILSGELKANNKCFIDYINDSFIFKVD